MKRNLSKLSSGIFLFLILFTSCQKDKLDNKLILSGEPVAIYDLTIYESLKNFSAYEFKNYSKIEFKETMNLEIRFGGDFSWSLNIVENISLTENLVSYITTEEGTFEIEQIGKHYKGSLSGNIESSVRVSFYDNKMAGFIFDGNETFQIIHLNTVSDLDNYPDVMIVCKDNDIITNDETM